MSLPWRGFDPWLGNLAVPKKKKKRKELSAYDVCSINCGRDDDNDGIDGSGPER